MNEYRQLKDDQTVLQSQNSKNLEALSQFYQYKEFLDSMAPKEKQDEMKKRQEERRQRKERQRSAANLPSQ